MSAENTAREIIWNDFLKVVFVEPHTGAYEVIKAPADPTGAEERLLQARDIYSYVQKQADEWLIHPDDTGRFMVTLNGIKAQARREHRPDGRRFSRKLRYRVGGEYQWVSFDIIYPDDYSENSHCCLFCIHKTESFVRSSDGDTELADLAASYIKVLKINLTLDSYEIMKLPAEEAAQQPDTPHISDWFALFLASHGVHPDDEAIFEEFTRLDRIKEGFAGSQEPQRCRYRRRSGDEWHTVTMELIPSVEFTENEQIVMLYIRVADDSKTEKFTAAARIEAGDDMHDPLTGLKNSRAMSCDAGAIESGRETDGVGVLYSSINLLPYVIAKLGRETGDRIVHRYCDSLTSIFRDSTCYRLSATEFMVMQPDVMMSQFFAWGRDFRALIHRDTPPSASIGLAWEKHPNFVSTLIDKAEKMMLSDRKLFMEKYPKFASKVGDGLDIP